MYGNERLFGVWDDSVRDRYHVRDILEICSNCLASMAITKATMGCYLHEQRGMITRTQLGAMGAASLIDRNTFTF